MLMKRQELLRCKLQRRKSEDGTRRGNTQSEYRGACNREPRKLIRDIHFPYESYISTKKYVRPGSVYGEILEVSHL